MASPSVTRPIPFEVPAVEIHAGFFFLLALLFAFSLGDPVVVAGILLSIAAHEAGHLIPAFATGTRVKALGANFMGCFNRREQAANPSAEFIIILGGPLASLGCALSTSGLVARFNWFLLLATMLPLGCSDGRRLLRLLTR